MNIKEEKNNKNKFLLIAFVINEVLLYILTFTNILSRYYVLSIIVLCIFLMITLRIFKIKLFDNNLSDEFKYIFMAIIVVIIYFTATYFLRGKDCLIFYFKDIDKFQHPVLIGIASILRQIIYPAFIEECLYRFLLMGFLKKHISSINVCNVIQAVIFGLSHFWANKNAFGSYQVSFILILMSTSRQAIFGYILGRYYNKTHSIVGASIIHGLSNFVQYFI